jgi:phosphoglycerate dehydrogenase-like enzyme
VRSDHLVILCLILRKPAGTLKNNKADHGTWEENRRQETEFSSNDPTVLVIGAGHSGLEITARLKYIGVPHADRRKTGQQCTSMFQLESQPQTFLIFDKSSLYKTR